MGKSLACALHQSKSIYNVLLGGVFIALVSQICIPLQPVPMTLHTLSIFLLAISQGGRKAMWSSIVYLGLATLGMPVHAGGFIDPLWMFGPWVGYLVAFPFAAYLIGTMVEKKENPSSLWIMASIFCGQIVIYSFGVTGLARFVSWENSILLGLVPFLPTMGLKLLIATSTSRFCLRLNRG